MPFGRWFQRMSRKWAILATGVRNDCRHRGLGKITKLTTTRTESAGASSMFKRPPPRIPGRASTSPCTLKSSPWISIPSSISFSSLPHTASISSEVRRPSIPSRENSFHRPTVCWMIERIKRQTNFWNLKPFLIWPPEIRFPTKIPPSPVTADHTQTKH